MTTSDPVVVVTGTGVVSPVGTGTARFHHAITHGMVGTTPVTRFPTEGRYVRNRAGEVDDVDRTPFDGLPLSACYALIAARESLTEATIDGRAPGPRVGIVLGTVMAARPNIEHATPAGSAGHTGPEILVTEAARRLGLTGPRTVVCTGCSAGNDAVSLAVDLIRSGRADAMLAGGTDELSETVFAMFTSLRALAPDVVRPFDRDRAGLMPAEGAGVLLLESADSARRRGAPILATVLACSSASDAHHPTAPRPDGSTLKLCMREVLHRSGTAPADVGWVSAHGTGTPSNDVLEAQAIGTVFDGARRPAVSSIKGMLGHAQGAASALESVACVSALRSGVLPGSPTLRTLDPGCGTVDIVTGPSRASVISSALNIAHGFGGTVSAVLFGRGDS